MMRIGSFLILAVVIFQMAVPLDAPCNAEEIKLRNWYLGINVSNGQRNRYDVFGADGIVENGVASNNPMLGLFMGRRFGDRFLLGLQFAIVEHDLPGGQDKLYDSEALFVGTVLFRQRDTFQPFFKGGFGGTGEILAMDGDSGHLFSLGTAAIAGGGLQVRLSSRFSLELETVATFANFLEVQNTSDFLAASDDSWQVRTSNYGYRIGLGAAIWF